MKKERFWNDSKRVVDKVGNGHRSCVVGDLNRWFGDKMLLEFQERMIMKAECLWVIHTRAQEFA